MGWWFTPSHTPAASARKHPRPPAGLAANARQPAAWAQGERLNDERHDAHGFAHPSKKSGMVFGASLIGDIILLFQILFYQSISSESFGSHKNFNKEYQK